MQYHNHANEIAMATRHHHRRCYFHCLLVLCFVLLTITRATAFVLPLVGSKHAVGREVEKSLFAAKKKAGKKSKPKQGGGGFGGGASTKTAAAASKTKESSSIIKPVKADKDSLEKQWDNFAAITDLEIKPLGDPENDPNYVHYEVADVFVRSGGDSSSESSTGWFRIGKICASDAATIEASLTLQKGLIFWTAVHMRRELMALGKASASSLELGYIVPPIVYMGTETDGPMEDDEADTYLKIATKASPEVLAKIQNNNNKTEPSFGFRPDWNPSGFKYKRQESAALKGNSKKSASSRLEDALADDDDVSD
jgi:hypothetical protein